MPRTAFTQELVSLINRHSIEGASNTPDYILAMYLKNCLSAYETAISQREEHAGVTRIASDNVQDMCSKSSQN